MTNSEDKQLNLLHKKLKLMKSLIHYCGSKKLGMYTSASNQLLELIEELEGDIDQLPFHQAATAQSNLDAHAA